SRRSRCPAPSRSCRGTSPSDRSAPISWSFRRRHPSSSSRPVRCAAGSGTGRCMPPTGADTASCGTSSSPLGSAPCWSSTSTMTMLRGTSTPSCAAEHTSRSPPGRSRAARHGHPTGRSTSSRSSRSDPVPLLDENRVALLYGDVSPNITDGSSIWLATMAEMLSEIFDEVHLLLKEVDRTRRVLKPVHDLPNVTFHPPLATADAPEASEGSFRLVPRRAGQRIATIAREIVPDAIITRGTDVAAFVSGNPELARIHWAYITDLPYPPDRISINNLTKLQRIAERAHRMFAQTEDARSYLESIAPAAAGKTALLTPTVPDRYFHGAAAES